MNNKLKQSDFWQLTMTYAVPLLVTQTLCAQPIQTEKPNIIIILADDLGYGDLSCYNQYSKISTPNIDKLARQGISYTDVHTASSLSTPSRYALLTGRYCWRTRLKRDVLWPYGQTLIEKDRKTIAHLFNEEGYNTALFGKWHLGWDWPVFDSVNYDWEKRWDGNWSGKGIDLSKEISGGPRSAGFSYQFGVDVINFPPYCFIENGKIIGETPIQKKPENMFGANGVMQKGWDYHKVLPLITNKSIDYIRERGREKPFFIYLSLTAPHTPIVPNREFEGKANAGDYGDFVFEMDYYIGKVLDVLDEMGIRDNTLVIFSSDNGSPGFAGDPFIRGEEFNQYNAVERMYGHRTNAPWKGMKSDIWEGGHRIPFIVSWPGKIPMGKTSNRMFGLVDLMATFHALLNREMDAHAGEDSYNVLPYWLDYSKDTLLRDHLIMHSGNGMFAIRKDGWKFIADSSSGGKSYKYKEMLGTYVSEFPGQLYNMEVDSLEQNNLYGSNPEKVNELHDLLEFYKTSCGSNAKYKLYKKIKKK